jgi:hypothetical protein
MTEERKFAILLAATILAARRLGMNRVSDRRRIAIAGVGD